MLDKYFLSKTNALSVAILSSAHFVSAKIHEKLQNETK